MKIKKKGVLVSGGFGNTAPLYEMKMKTLDDGSAWARIHWLDVTATKTWFTSDTEVMKCIDKTNRYSRMSIVDKFKTSNGVYEFMLTYPSLSSTLYNRWTQTSSPNAETVTGFTKITTAWDAHNAGIRRTGGPSVYNCDSETTWFAPIGQKTTWTETQYIPAADGSSQTSTELWVRIDTLPQETQTKIYNNFIVANDFYEI